MNGLSLLSDLRGRLAGLSRRHWLTAVMVGWLVLSADGPGLWPQPPVDPPRVIYTRPAPCEDEEGQEAQAPDGPGPHEHVWVDDQYFPWFDMQAACVNVGDGSEAARYVRCGDYVEVSPGSPLDWDICGNEGCSFPGGLADNAVSVEQWDDGGAEGQFGHFEPTGFVADGYITHYKAPMQPGLVSLQNRVDDIHYAEDPATGQPVQTFDDFPPDGVWGSATTITVWDFTISDGAPGFRPVLDAWVGPFGAKIEPATDHNGQSMARPIYFELFSSAEPGYCLNRTREHDPHEWNDTGLGDTDLKFSFPDQQGLTVHSTDFNGWWQNEAWTNEEVTTCAVDIMCLDYGAFGTLTATATVIGYPTAARLLLSDNPRTYSTYQVNGQTLYREYAPIPWDVDANYIADVWMRNSGNAADDEEDEGQCPVKGDGFTRYEEYRGFCVNGPWTELDPDAHKDVFVLDWNGLGIGDFAALGVVPHRLYVPQQPAEFGPDYQMNPNRGTANKQLQHGVMLVVWVNDPGYLGYTVPRLNAPKPTSRIDVVQIQGLFPPPQQQEAVGVIVSHELGHACNLEHHRTGTFDCIMWDPPTHLPHAYCSENPGCRMLWRLY